MGGRYVGSVKVAIVSGIEYGDGSGGGGGEEGAGEEINDARM